MSRVRTEIGFATHHNNTRRTIVLDGHERFFSTEGALRLHNSPHQLVNAGSMTYVMTDNLKEVSDV